MICCPTKLVWGLFLSGSCKWVLMLMHCPTWSLLVLLFSPNRYLSICCHMTGTMPADSSEALISAGGFAPITCSVPCWPCAGAPALGGKIRSSAWIAGSSLRARVLHASEPHKGLSAFSRRVISCLERKVKSGPDAHGHYTFNYTLLATAAQSFLCNHFRLTLSWCS